MSANSVSPGLLALHRRREYLQAYEGYGGAASEPSNPIEGEIEDRLEDEFQLWRSMGDKRPPRNACLMLAVELGVTAQNIGKWMTRRARLEDGEPVQQQKTAEQVDALEDAIEGNPYPSHDEVMQIAEETGLTKKQIKAWFQYQRKKRGITMDFETGIVEYDV